MNRYSKFVTLTGGILAFFCFALPWESNYSGLQLANGLEGIITIVFVMSIYIICMNICLITVKSDFNPVFITITFIVGLIGTYGCLVTFSRNSDVNLNYVTVAFIASLQIIGTSIYLLTRQTPWRLLSKLWGHQQCCWFLLFSCFNVC